MGIARGGMPRHARHYGPVRLWHGGSGVARDRALDRYNGRMTVGSATVVASEATLVARDVEKVYAGTGEPVVALRRVSLTLARGEFVAIMGPSGCGKSTLLHVCGAMDRPSHGSVTIGDRDLATLDDGALTRLRREAIGFVFQFFNLLPMLTVRENIALPLLLAGADSASTLQEAVRLAGRVGLAHRLDHHPAQLSGGEMQRAAIARALVHRPTLLVADEPTGNLDSANGAHILDLLVELHRETGVSILLATHAEEVAALADRIVRMRDGHIEREERRVGDGGSGGSSAPGSHRASDTNTDGGSPSGRASDTNAGSGSSSGRAPGSDHTVARLPV
jgi:putative ABC transport system ATP-binding protein